MSSSCLSSSPNVDALIETAGQLLLGQVGVDSKRRACSAMMDADAAVLHGVPEWSATLTNAQRRLTGAAFGPLCYSGPLEQRPLLPMGVLCKDGTRAKLDAGEIAGAPVLLARLDGSQNVAAPKQRKGTTPRIQPSAGRSSCTAPAPRPLRRGSRGASLFYAQRMAPG